MKKREFGAMLAERLASEHFDISALSRWAYQVYLGNVRELEVGLREILLELACMEDSEQFEFSHSELVELAARLKDPGNL